MDKRRGLGRGLDALLGTTPPAAADAGAVLRLPLEVVQPSPIQPRRHMDPGALEELAASMRSQGVLQPIVVRAVTQGSGYEIIAGERRWRAAALAGLTHIPAVVRQVDDGTALAVALVENIQRAELNPLEEAQAMEKLRGLCGMTHEAIATAVGRSRAAVTNLLRLLDLEEPVQDLLLAGALEMGHARALLALAGPTQVQAAEEVARGQLSVRRTEELVRRLLQGAGDKEADTEVSGMPTFMQQAQSSLSARFGLPVVIQPRRGGGQVVIRFQDRQQLEGLLQGLLEEGKPQSE